MKSKTRDNLLILLAVATIYGSGHGFGYIVGTKSSPAPAPEAPETQTRIWADTTLESLRGALDLTPEQVEAIRRDVDETAAAIADTRQRALLEYHMLLLRLHDRIEPKVDASRREALRRSQEKLRSEIDEKFAFPESQEPG